MRALKVLIVVMGVLIVVASAVIVVEVINRAGDPERRAAVAEERAAQPAGRTAETALDLPSGARIGEMLAIGNRLAFRVSVPEGDDRLYVLDPRTGALTATVTTGKSAARKGETQ